jgi:hypothetical protein
MQEKHSNGLFIDSSCRRAGLLKTLLHGLHHHRNKDVSEEEGQLRPVVIDPGAKGAGGERHQDSMKRAVSL